MRILLEKNGRGRWGNCQTCRALAMVAQGLQELFFQVMNKYVANKFEMNYNCRTENTISRQRITQHFERIRN
jgi:hypothetical protein